MVYLDFVAVTHGLLGVLLLMGIAGSLAALWKTPKRMKPARIFSVLATASAFLIVLFGDLLYIMYRSPGNARTILKAGENKWAHSIGMEFKEHVGHYVPLLLLVTTIIVFYYGDDLIKNAKLRKAALAFLILALIYTIIELIWGALITGIQPVI